MAITPQTTQPQTQLEDLTPLDTSVPAAPTFGGAYQGVGYTPPMKANNTYQQGTPQYDIYQNYMTQLGRAPESDAVVQNWARNPNFVAGISSSPEAQTLGRARNEVNSSIDSQLQGFQRSIEQGRLASQGKLESLNPFYNQQFGELQFGMGEQQNALDAARARMLEDQTVGAQRYQSQVDPAILAARNAANRSGLLNSTVAIDRVNQGLSPIFQGLGNLAMTTQRGLQDSESKRQGLIQKYLFERQGLSSKRDQEAKAIRDQLAQLVQQAQDQQNQLEQTRTPSTYARSGELSDQFRQFQLQQQALQEQIRAAQATEGLSRDQFNYNKSKG